MNLNLAALPLFTKVALKVRLKIIDQSVHYPLLAKYSKKLYTIE